DPAPADVAGAGARVHRRGRVRRGDAAVGAPAQGDHRTDRASHARQARQDCRRRLTVSTERAPIGRAATGWSAVVTRWNALEAAAVDGRVALDPRVSTAWHKADTRIT